MERAGGASVGLLPSLSPSLPHSGEFADGENGGMRGAGAGKGAKVKIQEPARQYIEDP